jgi:hypothetical protein
MAGGEAPTRLAPLRITRRRVLLLLFVLGLGVLAVVDRKAAYVTLYVLGIILLVLGSAAGMTGGVIGPLPGGEGDAAKAYRHTMEQRAAWLSHNLLFLLAGAILIGLAVLLQLA